MLIYLHTSHPTSAITSTKSFPFFIPRSFFVFRLYIFLSGTFFILFTFYSSFWLSFRVFFGLLMWISNGERVGFYGSRLLWRLFVVLCCLAFYTNCESLTEWKTPFKCSISYHFSNNLIQSAKVELSLDRFHVFVNGFWILSLSFTSETLLEHFIWKRLCTSCTYSMS